MPSCLRAGALGVGPHTPVLGRPESLADMARRASCSGLPGAATTVLALRETCLVVGRTVAAAAAPTTAETRETVARACALPIIVSDERGDGEAAEEDACALVAAVAVRCWAALGLTSLAAPPEAARGSRVAASRAFVASTSAAMARWSGLTDPLTGSPPDELQGGERAQQRRERVRRLAAGAAWPALAAHVSAAAEAGALPAPLLEQLWPTCAAWLYLQPRVRSADAVITTVVRDAVCGASSAGRAVAAVRDRLLHVALQPLGVPAVFHAPRLAAGGREDSACAHWAACTALALAAGPAAPCEAGDAVCACERVRAAVGRHVGGVARWVQGWHSLDAPQSNLRTRPRALPRTGPAVPRARALLWLLLQLRWSDAGVQEALVRLDALAVLLPEVAGLADGLDEEAQVAGLCGLLQLLDLAPPSAVRWHSALASDAVARHVLVAQAEPVQVAAAACFARLALALGPPQEVVEGAGRAGASGAAVRPTDALELWQRVAPLLRTAQEPRRLGLLCWMLLHATAACRLHISAALSHLWEPVRRVAGMYASVGPLGRQLWVGGARPGARLAGEHAHVRAAAACAALQALAAIELFCWPRALSLAAELAEVAAAAFAQCTEAADVRDTWWTTADASDQPCGNADGNPGDDCIVRVCSVLVASLSVDLGRDDAVAVLRVGEEEWPSLSVLCQLSGAT